MKSISIADDDRLNLVDRFCLRFFFFIIVFFSWLFAHFQLSNWNLERSLSRSKKKSRNGKFNYIRWTDILMWASIGYLRKRIASTQTHSQFDDEDRPQTIRNEARKKWNEYLSPQIHFISRFFSFFSLLLNTTDSLQRRKRERERYCYRFVFGCTEYEVRPYFCYMKYVLLNP